MSNNTEKKRMQTLLYDVSLLRNNATKLRSQLEQQPERMEMVALESLEELQTMLEELRVSQEELLIVQQEAESERRHYLDLFEFAPCGYLVTDENGVIREANRVAVGLLNVSPGFLINKPLIVFIAEADKKACYARLHQLRSEKGTERLDNIRMVIRRRGGALFPAVVNVAVRRDWCQRVVGLRWMLQDLTEDEQTTRSFSVVDAELTRQIAEHSRSSEQSSADWEQFTDVASRDLQDPLRDISTSTKLLERLYSGKIDADADSLISRLVENARHMQLVIRDLLAYTQATRRADEHAVVNCESVLEKVLADLQETIAQTQATVTHDSLPIVEGSEKQWEQLFVNLLDNALKFRGDEPPRIHVSAQQQGGQWLFAVQDNGIGIASRYAERVFLLFERLHAKQKYPGAGLGLAVCKKIVEQHGGRIWVESERGQGAKFRFTVPAAV